jgi:DNA helicase-4
LATNYRCPRNVVEASNALIAAGTYADKPAIASSTEDYTIQLIEKTGNGRYEDWELETAKDLLTKLLAERRSDEEILVLARYNFRLEQLKVAFPGHQKQKLSFKSIHSAKGTEADCVLVLGCIGGEFGFPSKVLEENLLEIVSARKQDAKEKLEEERRLFYVALTRCRKQLFLFTSVEERSQFLTEIAEFVGLDRLSRKAQSEQGAGNSFDSSIQMGLVVNPAKFCRRCGKPVTPPGRFCTHCGNPIPTP